MKRPYIFQKCLSPVRVKDRHRVDMFVPCGHCVACNFSKQSVWRSRLTHHINTPGIYPVFITLTYDNAYLPLVHYDDDGNITSMSVGYVRKLPPHTVNFRKGDFLNPYNGSMYRKGRYSFFNSDLSSLCLSHLSKPHFVLSRTFYETIFDTSNSFAVCYKPHVQNFIKRLRQNISYNRDLVGEDTSFDYFICSEYGPKTFRPHYHGILFFRSSNIAKWAVSSGVFDSWQYQAFPENPVTGKPIASEVIQGDSAAAYVSKYVTSIIDVPPVLTLSPFRIFHCQSKSCPIGSEAFNLSDVPRMLSEDDFLHNIQYQDQSTKELIELRLPYPSSAWSRVFPRFLCDNFITLSIQLKIFHRLRSISSPSSIPDLRPDLIRRFGFDSVVVSPRLYSTSSRSLYVPSKTLSFREFLSFLPTDSSDVMRLNDDEWLQYDIKQRLSRHPLNSVTSYRITPSHIITSSDWIDSYLDYYLFGFEQNRAACRKIISCMNSVPWCSDPLYYSSQYSLYRTKLFNFSVKTYYDEVLSVTPPTPFTLYNLYYSLFHRLPQRLVDVTDDLHSSLSPLLEFYNFDIHSFYDSSGNLYNFSFHSSTLGLDYLKSLAQKSLSQKSKNKYDHDICLAL